MNTNCGSDDEFNKRCMENHYCHYYTNWKCNMDELDRRPDCYKMVSEVGCHRLMASLIRIAPQEMLYALVRLTLVDKHF